MTLIQSVDRLQAFHLLVRSLRLRQVFAWGLKRFPLVRTLSPSGVRYRLRHLETFFLADEVFRRRVYARAVDPDRTRTFCDLGSHVGLFAAFLADETRRRDLRGILVDANREMVEESRWTLEANGLKGVVALHGLVATGSTGGSGDFYLHPSSLGSSRFPVHEPGKRVKGPWSRTRAPCLDLEAAWLGHVGDARCDLLKVDIEGSEQDLFRRETAFLGRVNTIVLEWHRWIVSRQELDRALSEQGFALEAVLEEGQTTGVSLYRRRA